MSEGAETEFDTILGELIRREATNKLAKYYPYPFQRKWHNAKGKGTKYPARQKALMCANKIGKTYCGVHEDAFHLTGQYPPWWKGVKFTHPVNVMVAGVSVELVRDTIQADLFGDPHDDSKLGTGAIPGDLIHEKPIKKPGYVDAIDTCQIRHVSGGLSTLKLLAYEQGFKKFYARGYHVVHFDEEPPQLIYSQGLRAVIATGGIINLTFTAEEGVTQVVDNYMNDLKKGQAFVSATWDDAPHIRNNPKHRAQLLEAIPPYEREMRIKGIPRMGSGMIYPVSDEILMVKPFEIPPWWPRICGIDFGGFDHPFAAAWLATDPETDTTFVYKTYKNMGAVPVHADALRRHQCGWIPTAWPHDVGMSDKQSGRPMASIFRDDYQLNMLPKAFSNPPSPYEQEGQGGAGVNVGLYAIHTAMETGRFKVFDTESEWFREKGLYHRKATTNGRSEIVKRMDDLMDATRYAYQSLRFADIKPRDTTYTTHAVPQGVSNW